MFALKLGSFGFDLIIPMESLTVIPFSCSEKIYEEFDNVCTLNEQLIFFDRQNHNRDNNAIV